MSNFKYTDNIWYQFIDDFGPFMGFADDENIVYHISYHIQFKFSHNVYWLRPHAEQPGP